MDMKRVVVLCVVCLVAMLSFAQEGTAIGFQVGFAETIYRLNNPTAEDHMALSAKPQNGFKFGFVFEDTFWKGMGTMVGINYTYTGSNTKWEKYGDYGWQERRYRSKMHQLEIVADWQYKFEIAKQTYVLLYSGPTIQVGLSQTYTIVEKQMEGGDKQTTYSSYDFKDDLYQNDFNRLNVTWGVGAGFQYDRYYLRGGYDFGLFNPYRVRRFVEPDGYYTRGRLDQWHIKVGVFLWQSNK